MKEDREKKTPVVSLVKYRKKLLKHLLTQASDDFDNLWSLIMYIAPNRSQGPGSADLIGVRDYKYYSYQPNI